MIKKFAWTEEKLQYLREHYPTEAGSDIADVLGCASSTVTQKARELGIRKDPSFKTSNFIGRYVRRGVIKKTSED